MVKQVFDIFQGGVRFRFEGNYDQALIDYQHDDGEAPYIGSFSDWCLLNLTPVADHGWLTEEYLGSIGFVKQKDDGQYGVYVNKAGEITPHYGITPGGKRVLTFNRDPKRLYVGIKEDGGTRMVFNGIIDRRESLEAILNLVA